MSAYHADNEYCSLSDMKDAAKILCEAHREVRLIRQTGRRL